MSALRCKEVIDAAARAAGSATCLIGAVALNGAQGREPSVTQAQDLVDAAKLFEQAASAIIDAVQPDDTL